MTPPTEEQRTVTDESNEAGSPLYIAHIFGTPAVREDALAACPFCGGEPWAEFFRTPQAPRAIMVKVSCRACESTLTRSGPEGEAQEAARSAWNRRASSPAGPSAPEPKHLSRAEVIERASAILHRAEAERAALSAAHVPEPYAWAVELKGPGMGWVRIVDTEEARIRSERESTRNRPGWQTRGPIPLYAGAAPQATESSR